MGHLLRSKGGARVIDKTIEVKLPDGSSMNFEFKGERNRGILLKVGRK